jgi:hypothetical protein
MCPDRLVLLAQESIRVELVRVQRPVLVVFDALSQHGMLHADGYLWEDAVRLDGNEDVVSGDAVQCRHL